MHSHSPGLRVSESRCSCGHVLTLERLQQRRQPFGARGDMGIAEKQDITLGRGHAKVPGATDPQRCGPSDDPDARVRFRKSVLPSVDASSTTKISVLRGRVCVSARIVLEARALPSV